MGDSMLVQVGGVVDPGLLTACMKADLAWITEALVLQSLPTPWQLPLSLRQLHNHLHRHLNHQSRAHITAKLAAGLTSDDSVDRSPSVAFHASQVLINKHESKCPVIPLHT